MKAEHCFLLVEKNKPGEFSFGHLDFIQLIIFNLYRASTNQGIRDMKEMMSVLRPFWMNPRCYTFDGTECQGSWSPLMRTKGTSPYQQITILKHE